MNAMVRFRPFFVVLQYAIQSIFLPPLQVSVLFLAASASAGGLYNAGLNLNLGYGAPLGLGLGYGAVAAAPLAYAAPIAKAAPLVSSYAIDAPAPIIAKKPLGVYGGVYGGYAPAAIAITPSSQYKAQDAYGNVKFGYQNVNSARKEAIGPYGAAAGSYSYVDSYGIPQQVISHFLVAVFN